MLCYVLLCHHVMPAWVVYGLATWPCPKLEIRRCVLVFVGQDRQSWVPGPLLIPFDSRLSTHSKPLGHDFVNEKGCPQRSCSKLKHSWQNYPSLLLVSCRMAPNTRVKAEQGTTYNLTTMLNLERVPISECVQASENI